MPSHTSSGQSTVTTFNLENPSSNIQRRRGAWHADKRDTMLDSPTSRRYTASRLGNGGRSRVKTGMHELVMSRRSRAGASVSDNQHKVQKKGQRHKGNGQARARIGTPPPPLLEHGHKTLHYSAMLYEQPYRPAQAADRSSARRVTHRLCRHHQGASLRCSRRGTAQRRGSARE